MRLKKGTKVEVLTKKEVPSGSWRCAEIIGGNGHKYAVRYHSDLGSFGKAVVERVIRKAVRPCPPSADVLEDWTPGDVIEVFHNFSWKMATVLKMSGRNHLLVRLTGSAIEFKANKYDVRARLCWQDGKWIIIGQASGRYEDARFRLPSSRKDNSQSQKMGTILSQCIKDDHVSDRDINSILESQAIPSRILKQKPSNWHSEIKAYGRGNRKINAGEKNSLWSNFGVLQRHQLQEKVDEVTCSREVLAERSMHPVVNQITRSSKLILEKEKTDGVAGCSRSISLDTDDNSITSSVGSCSVYGNFSHAVHHSFTTCPSEDNDHQCSDAESFCRLRSVRRTCHLPEKEELTEEIHRLELHAYRRILEALHASGPLSWEQELLLTNLRDSLNISSDEHLMEIRNLVSSNACITSSCPRKLSLK